MLLLAAFKFVFLGIILFVLSYFLLTFLCSFISVNKKFQSVANGIDLHLSSNGFHTDFILPIKTDQFDWSNFIDLGDFATGEDKTTYLGIGWGEKSIYLDLPAWSELTFKMGMKALFLPTPALMHLTTYDKVPTTSFSTFKTKISKQQYLSLCHYILSRFEVDGQQKIQLITGVGYTPNDNFYQANGQYHAFNTCNTWVNNGLKVSGIRAPLWTTLDKSIFHQLKKIKTCLESEANLTTINYESTQKEFA